MMLKTYLIMIAAFSIEGHLSAQTPQNDDCSTSQTIYLDNACLPVVGTLSLSTQSMAPITCGAGTSALAKDVWFSFQASSPTATITAAPSAQPGNNFNLVLGLYSACSGSLLACADVFGNLQPETINASGLIAAGNTYYLRIYQYKNNTSSADPVDPTFSICVQSDGIYTGVNKLQRNDLKISPNPARNFLMLDEELVQSIHAILIYDINGKLVFYTDEIKQNLDISQITPGTYTIQCLRCYGDFNSSERVYRQNFIKE